jgi:hypothetical protein
MEDSAEGRSENVGDDDSLTDIDMGNT